MNKEQFDALDKIEQINYINNQLSKGQTLIDVCKSIGIGRTTIRDRFERIGYKYNNKAKQYQLYIEVIDLETSSPAVEGKPKYINDDLKKIIENYDELNNKMDELYTWYKSQESSSLAIEEGKFTIKDFKGDTVTRSFKMYESVQKKFMKFCKKHSQYRVQDILSTLLDEAMEKYK